MEFIHFFISQGPIGSAVLETQSNGALAFSNALAFIDADEHCVYAVLNVLIVGGENQLSHANLSINEQRNIAHDGRKPRQAGIKHRQFFDLQERRQIDFSDEDRLSEFMYAGRGFSQPANRTDASAVDADRGALAGA